MMIAISRTLLLSAALTAAPLVAAMAQANGPGSNYESNRSTATTGAGHNGGKFGMNTGNAGSGATTGADSAAASGEMAGASGHTLVAPSQTNHPDATVHMRRSQSGNGHSGGQ